MPAMGEVFRGREALGDGLPRHELRRWYRPLFRGVYVPKNAVPSLMDRAVGAWLTSDRRGVIAGVAASALHGAASLLDFLDAERSYRSTQLAYRQALASYLLGLEQLREAVGTRSLP